MVSNWVIVGARLDSQFLFGPLNPPHHHHHTPTRFTSPVRFGTPATTSRYVGRFCIVVVSLLAAQLFENTHTQLFENTHKRLLRGLAGAGSPSGRQLQVQLSQLSYFSTRELTRHKLRLRYPHVFVIGITYLNPSQGTCLANSSAFLSRFATLEHTPAWTTPLWTVPVTKRGEVGKVFRRFAFPSCCCSKLVIRHSHHSQDSRPPPRSWSNRTELARGAGMDAPGSSHQRCSKGTAGRLPHRLFSLPPSDHRAYTPARLQLRSSVVCRVWWLGDGIAHQYGN
jgi:hypothetical protein